MYEYNYRNLQLHTVDYWSYELGVKREERANTVEVYPERHTTGDMTFNMNEYCVNRGTISGHYTSEWRG